MIAISVPRLKLGWADFYGRHSLSPDQGGSIENPYPDKIAIKDGNETTLIPIDGITWVEAARDYMCIHTDSGLHILRSTMKDLESKLDPQIFQRVHRSTIVNLNVYEQLTEWRDTLIEKIKADNPGLIGMNWDYKETKPQLDIQIDYQRAAELGVTVNEIGRSLAVMLGPKKVTTYIDEGKEYTV